MMRTNVFLRSTCRQPVRILLLLLVIALVTFAFVGRASEYLLISQEIDRLESYYRTIGTLQTVLRQADTDAAADWLEADSRVGVVNTYGNLYGVIQDGFDNADTDWGTVNLYGFLSRYEAALGRESGRWFTSAHVLGRNDNEACRGLNIVPLRDMSALPIVQERSAQIYLTEGRWLDSRDDQAERRVCVINANLATMQGLDLGDSITMELRDMPSYFGYCLPLSQEEYDGLSSVDVVTETFEIVGIYDYFGKYKLTCMRNFTYIPASVVPETFDSSGGRIDRVFYESLLEEVTTSASLAPPFPGEVSFALNDPEDAAQFATEARTVLLKLRFHLEFVDNGWENFHAVVVPMQRASLVSLFLYLLVLLAALCLVDFTYFWTRSKELAIVRAMGVPVGRCVREETLPLLLVALPGVLTGGVLGWRNTLQNAEQTLSALASLDADGGAGNTLPPVYLVGLWGGVLTLLLVLTSLCALFLAKRPVLEQIQDGVRRRGCHRPSVPEPPPINAADLSLEAVRAVRSGIPAKQQWRRQVLVALRFLRRQIVRAPVKTALVAVLAAAFVIGLGAIDLSMTTDRRELDRLYEVTPVNLDLVRRDTTQTTVSSGFLFDETIQAVLDTGFVADCYLEGASHCRVFLYDSPWEAGEMLHVKVREQTNRTIRSFENAERFFSAGGSGERVAVTYLDDWDSDLFSKDWDDEDDMSFPIVLPKETYDQYGLGPGDFMGVACKGAFCKCVVAGYYEGMVAGDSTNAHNRSLYNENSPILMPTSALKVLDANVLYSRASFTVDPVQKRNLVPFRIAIDKLVDTAHIGNTPIRALLQDEELTQAVAPLEESLQLMRILYPVVFVLSLLTAAGTAALFVLMSAKDAATLRVLGTPRGRTQLILVLQQAVTCFAGLALGVAGMLLCLYQVRPELLEALAGAAVWRAAAYLAAAVAGAAVSSVAVTNKNPLDMLQVKE